MNNQPFTPTDPKEVMAALAQAEKVRQAQEELDEKLIEGLKSGPAELVDFFLHVIEMEELDWARLEGIAEANTGSAGRR